MGLPAHAHILYSSRELMVRKISRVIYLERFGTNRLFDIYIGSGDRGPWVDRIPRLYTLCYIFLSLFQCCLRPQSFQAASGPRPGSGSRAPPGPQAPGPRNHKPQ